MGNLMKTIEVVKYNPDGDGVTALYINGEYSTRGDYYHDKIDEWIDGFITGINHEKIKYNVKYYEVRARSNWKGVCEMADPSPEFLENIKGLKLVK